MDTSVVVESPGRRTHRRHGAEFKVQVVRACRQPGVSIAAVALANGLNANMLRRWVVEAEHVGAMAISGHRAVGVSATAAASGLPAFVGVQMPSALAASAEPDIQIELTRGPTTIVMRWPASLAGACATWLRELLR
jgi:transposase-like protein